MIVSGVTIQSPWYLLLLLLIPWFFWLARHSLTGLGRFRRLLVLGFRSAVVIAIVLALAEVQTRQTSRAVSVVYLLDQSLSIPPEEREGMFRYVARDVEAYRRAPRGDRVGVIVFGREAIVEVPPIEDSLDWLTRSEVVTAGLSEATSLADAAKLAMSILPDRGARRVVFVTDGNENIGDVRQVAVELAEQGVGIDVVAVQPERSVNVAVEKVVAPVLAKRGESIELRVVLRNDIAEVPGATSDRVAGRLRVTRRAGADTELVSDEEVTLAPGKSVFTLAESGSTPPGFYSYEAQFVATDIVERTLDDNRATAFTNREDQGRVLLIENVDSPGEFDRLVESLRESQLAVDVRNSALAFSSLAELQSYDCVVLANVARVSGQDGDVMFNDARIEALVRNTELGCGLVMLGGPHSFGAGGWANTRLEEASPVSFTIKNSKVIPSGALVLVIDKSGSMEGDKMAMSRQAAMEAVRVLSAKDYVGVVAFDGVATWAVPMQVIGHRREGMARQILRLAADGGTDMFPGMRMGFTGLQSVEASVKHMIVLTDGQTPPADFDQLTREMRKANITVSTVAVGNDASGQLLAGIARQGDGKFYVVNTPKAIPRIFIKEAMRVAKPLLFEREEGFLPQLAYPHEVLSGIDGPWPPITGFVLTELKDHPLVEVGLRSPLPTDESTSTILASWIYGLGRVLVSTTDAGQRWASSWTQWEQYDAYYEKMIRWAMRLHDSRGNFLVSTELRDGNISAVVTALDEDNNFIDSLPMTGNVTTPELGSIEMPLRQVAPGRYTGEVPADQSGTYLVTIHPGPGRGTIRTGVNVPYALEYKEREANLALLNSLALRKPVGGEPGLLFQRESVNLQSNDSQPFDTFRPTLAAAITLHDAWPYLLLFATSVFFFDVLSRRVVFDPAVILRWTARFRQHVEPSALNERMERLRQQKVTIAREVEQRTASVRFEENVENGVSDPVGPSTTPADLPKVLPTRTNSNPIVPEVESYTERLLQAKRKVQARHLRGGDGE